MKGELTLSYLAAAGVAMVVLIFLLSIGGQILNAAQEAMVAKSNTQTDNQSVTANLNVVETLTGHGANPDNYAAIQVWNDTTSVITSGSL